MYEFFLLILYNSDMLISNYVGKIWPSRQNFTQIKL